MTASATRSAARDPVEEALQLSSDVARLLEAAEARAQRAFDETLGHLAEAPAPPRAVRADEERVAGELLAELGPSLDAAWAFLAAIEPRLSARERAVVHAAWRARVAPWFLRTKLGRRSLDKPLGYDGDFGMVELIYEQPEEPGSALGRALNRYVWQVGPCRAHRARRPWAIEHLRALRAARRRPLRVLSYACGPEHTLRTWVTEAADTEVHLADAEPLALSWCREQFTRIEKTLGRTIGLSTWQVSAEELVAGDALDAAVGHLDGITVLGLFDYLAPRTVTALVDRLVGRLAPGGRLLCTNVHSENPWRPFMETVGGWRVIHRTEGELVELALHGRADLRLVESRLDESGTNVFVAVERV